MRDTNIKNDRTSASITDWAKKRKNLWESISTQCRQIGLCTLREIDIQEEKGVSTGPVKKLKGRLLGNESISNRLKSHDKKIFPWHSKINWDEETDR